MWTNVTDRLRRRGTLWTTDDRRPTQEDIQAIADRVDRFAVGYAGQAIRHFRLEDDELVFVESGPMFRPDELPRFCTDKMAAFLHGLPSSPFAPRDVAHLCGGDNRLVTYYLQAAKREGWVVHLGRETWQKDY